MKKVLIGLVMLSLIAGAVFAGGSAEDARSSNKIILSNAYYTAPYCAAFNPAAIERARELGYELQILDGDRALRRVKRIDYVIAAGFAHGQPRGEYSQSQR